MTGDIILTSITKSELEELIAGCFKKLGVGYSLPEASKEDEMNLKSCAAWLGVSQSTLISYKKRKLLPYQQLEGSSRVRFYKSEILKVLQKNPDLLQPARK